MKLVTLAAGGHPGVLAGDQVVDLVACRGALPDARLLPNNLPEILDVGPAALDIVSRIVGQIDAQASLVDRLREDGGLIAQSNAKLLAPLPNPALILSVGANYGEHMREMNAPIPDRPYAFTKNAAQVVGHGAAIVLPASNPDMVDWEGEFSLVIGRKCHNVSEDEALDYVAGYTLVNDVSARDWAAPVFQAKGTMGPIMAWGENLLGKMFPTFCPMGPVLCTRDEIKNPDDVDLSVYRNGELMQSANTSDLIFGVRKLIAYFSQFYQFRPGDVITTGSPSGVGFGRNPQIFMRAGDQMEVHGSGIGVLSNPVVAG